MPQHAAVPEEVQSLRSDVAAMLQDVKPSISEFGLRLHPCEVTTDDGVVHPRVYVVESHSYIREWGVWPWMDRGKRWVRAESIRFLRSSPERLPAEFANALNRAGESGMGYCAFSVEFKNGQRLYFVTGNAIDFPNWPDGASPMDIVRVRPHDRCPEHRGRLPLPHEMNAEYSWAPYRQS
jgi:hypothetical protein